MVRFDVYTRWRPILLCFNIMIELYEPISLSRSISSSPNGWGGELLPGI